MTGLDRLTNTGTRISSPWFTGDLSLKMAMSSGDVVPLAPISFNMYFISNLWVVAASENNSETP
jgi:hypothetical protein